MDDPLPIDALKTEAHRLGFSHISTQSIEHLPDMTGFKTWLNQGFQGEMHYMEKNIALRANPDALFEGVKTIITVRFPYYHALESSLAQLQSPEKAYVSRYALGRDYHTVLRKRLSQLGEWLKKYIPSLNYRAFTDSAPILEREYAEQSGLGFTGKNTLLIDPKQGSFFFLGELFIDHQLHIHQEIISNHCGRCSNCIRHCPTGAIVSPHMIDARKCISYLTIELHGEIPIEYRKQMGNRIYGCDDCQLYCPWNRFASHEVIADFKPRHALDTIDLLSLFAWSEAQFLKNMEGSPIRRIGYDRFLRNISVALGNAPYSELIVEALNAKLATCNIDYLQSHLIWAIDEQQCK